MQNASVVERFLEITKIPRPSGFEKKMVEFLSNFAKENTLEYVVDKNNNVLIKRDCKKEKTIILQAHIDMVCVKEINKNVNFFEDGISVINDGKFLYADGTSLGADDGIGVAVILDILQDKNLKSNYNIEALFTSCEETTMAGAKNFNCSKLSSNLMIGLDGTSISELTIGCAGIDGYEIFGFEKGDLTVKENNVKLKNCYKVEVKNLIGGHSGDDIGKKRANAINLIFDFLALLEDINIISVENKSGKGNAIANNATCLFLCNKELKEIISLLQKFKKSLKKYSDKEIDISIFEEDAKQNQKPIGLLRSERLINLFSFLKTGVIKKQKGKPVLSLNVGIIDVNNKNFNIIFTTRNFNTRLNNKLFEELTYKINNCGFKVKRTNSLPCFESKRNSFLQQKAILASEKVLKEKLVPSVCNGTVETTLFAKKIKNLDAIVLGANLFDLHSTKEKVEISSICVLNYLVREILK